MMSNISNVFNGFVSMFINDQQEKQEQILEPLTCIIKLGILYLKEDGTKLQIIGNSIHYHSPTVLQGTNRWIRGDNRNDLHKNLNILTDLDPLRQFPPTDFERNDTTNEYQAHVNLELKFVKY